MRLALRTAVAIGLSTAVSGCVVQQPPAYSYNPYSPGQRAVAGGLIGAGAGAALGGIAGGGKGAAIGALAGGALGAATGAGTTPEHPEYQSYQGAYQQPYYGAYRQPYGGGYYDAY